MLRSRRVQRPSAQSTDQHDPVRLSALAGRAEPPALDRLEPRQLLAAIDFTVDPNDPFFDDPLASIFQNLDGSYTVSAAFSYLIPYIVPAAEEADPEDDDPLTENFNDAGEDGDFILPGTVIGESNLVTAGATFQLFEFIDAEDNLGFGGFLQPGQSIDFSFLSGGDPGAAALAFDAMNFFFGSNFNLSVVDPSQIEVSFLLRGEVISDSAQLLSDILNGAPLPTQTPVALTLPDGAGQVFFDTVRFTNINDSIQQALVVDDISAQPSAGIFADIVDARAFGAEISFTAPLGATVKMFDLYGRAMELTLGVGKPDGDFNLSLADLDDNGVPEFNDGIGRIEITGTDVNSSFAIFGGLVEAGTDPTNFDIFSGGFGFNRPENGELFAEELREAQYGHIGRLDETGNWISSGLAGPVSVIIGSGFVRDLNAYGASAGVVDPLFDPFGSSADIIATTTATSQPFARADQGVFINDGSNIGQVYIAGLLNGSSKFTGFVDQLYAGVLMGNVNVDGDLGIFTVGGDAGVWLTDTDYDASGQTTDTVFPTRGELIVGRTLGEFYVAGRSQVSVTVVGDLGDADNAPPRDTQFYAEREFIAGINPALDGADESTVNLIRTGGNSLFQFRRAEIIGDTVFRNDSILSSEFVGNVSSTVRILGTLGLQDGLHTSEDLADVFALPVDGTRPVVIELGTGFFNLNVRLMDQDGRTVAAFEGFDQEVENSAIISFDPPAAGVYYLVVGAASPPGPIGDAAIGGFATSLSYDILVTGMAPVTLGAVTVAGNTNDFSSVNVLNGSIGAVRVGTAYIGGNGQAVGSNDVLNRTGADDAYLSLQGGSFTARGNLYQIVVGSDIEIGDTTTFAGTDIFDDLIFDGLTSFTIAGNLGSLVTGLSPLANEDGLGLEGDVNSLILDIGGTIDFIDIRGGVGIENDPPTGPNVLTGTGALSITTGSETGIGHIGIIRVSGHVGGGSFEINTANGSIIDAFLVSQDLDPAGISGGNVGFWGGSFELPNAIQTGIGSDVRFLSVPQIDLLGSLDADVSLIGSTAVELVDDGGGRVTIRVAGGLAGVNYGSIKFVPISGSEGVAIAQIDVNLNSGATVNPGLTLEIISNGEDDDVISIGRIRITDAVATTNLSAGSAISIRGDAEIDVWQIVQTGGNGFGSITNATVGGDLVSVDVVTIDTVNVNGGNLGRTETAAVHSTLLGRFIGIQAGENNQILGAVGVAGDAMGPFWNGATYRPITEVPVVLNGYADDHGHPLNPRLNGLVVRGGSVQQVSVTGQVGNIYLQGGDGTVLQSLVVNAGGDTPLGEFHGIVGVIYAEIIANINIGDGLIDNDNSPLLSSGIIAGDDIRNVVGTLDGAFMSAVIAAANTVFNTDFANNPDSDGIVRLSLESGGDFRDIDIHVSDLHQWWSAATAVDDSVSVTGDIQTIVSSDADMFRADLSASDIRSINLTNGFIDATTMSALNDILNVNAGGFRNSTITGEAAEFRQNRISAAGDIQTITTTGGDGDIRDTIFEVSGSILTRISANNIIRTSFNVANSIRLIETTGDFSGSEVVTGRLIRIDVGDTLATSSLNVAGPLETVEVGVRIIGADFLVTGPDGRIDSISTPEFLGGTVSSTGRIQLIEATEGDLSAFITTTTRRGSVDLITAAHDLDIGTDIAGSVGELVAGRHVGKVDSDRVILIQSDLSLLNAGGQLYSDLRVSRTINQVLLGPIPNLPGDNQLGTGVIEAFDRIERVTIVGDFDGSVRSFSNGIGLVEISNGSFLAGNEIAAFDGHIDEVRIVAGNLYGDVRADWILFQLNVVASADGVFGDIGINENRSSFTPYDDFRNELPPGVGPSAERQGPIISAGWNLGIINVSNGSIFEATIIAGWSIGIVNVNGDITADSATVSSGSLGTAIVANDSIFLVEATGSIQFSWILAGPSDLGADMTPGGTGENADTVSSGFIETIRAADMLGVVTSAGVNPGEDGFYNSGDDQIEIGVSLVRAIETTGEKVFVSSFSEAFGIDLITQGDVFLVGKLTLPVNSDDVVTDVTGVQLTPGVAFAFTNGAETGTLLFSGAGNAYWDEAKGLVILENTDAFTSTLTVTSDTGVLTNFDVSTTNDASIGTLTIQANLAGDSKIFIDAFASNIVTGDFDGTGGIVIGQHGTNVSTGSFRAATLSGKNVAFINIFGDFGSSTFDLRGDTGVDILSSGFVTITGDLRGRFNTERVIGSMVVNGALDNALVRSGIAIAALDVGSARESRISVGDFLETANFAGDVFDTSILLGGDLGPDADYDSVNDLGNDRATSGFAGAITIGGDFILSDIIGGSLRGADGFHGTDDDLVSKGRAVIGSVEIGGLAEGSNRETESYRVWATGALNGATVGGQDAVSEGNLEFGAIETTPVPISVLDLQVTERNREYTARIFFNQAMDASSFSAALTVAEIRGDSGEQRIELVEGTDYRVDYEPENNAMVIFFSSDVTSRNLPQTELPGPGLYRFELDQETLRAAVVQARLDGDGNGRLTLGEDYSSDNVVGDAGDKITDVPPATFIDPVTNEVFTIDFYRAVNLDILLDSNTSPNGLPDTNAPFTIRGTMGDHPDHNVDVFRFASDVDLYEITLQAGQILRLSTIEGAAFLANVDLIPSSQIANGTLSLPRDGTGSSFLVLETGTYFISVSNFFLSADLLDDNTVFDTANFAGGVGDYTFSLEVFDDGNTGFAAGSDSGDGDDIENAPEFSAFAGSDGILGTPDDVETVTRGEFVFSIDPGDDGVVGTADDKVTGTNGRGAISERDTANDLSSWIDGTIGSRRPSGVPGFISPDVDVFNLNAGRTIAAGTKMKITVKLSEIGGDLGSRNLDQDFLDFDFSFDATADFTGDVQFALFNTTNATDVSNAELLFSPTDFSPIGGTPNTLIADDGTVSYGFDENGDFYIEFVTPQGDPASYAVYIQGVFNSDYQLEVLTDAETSVLAKRRQNFVIELNGGTVDWLEIGGVSTELAELDLGAIGLVGSLDNGQSVDDFVVELLIENLQEIFDEAGLDVRFSTTPADFEFEDFSTIFISTSPDPLTPLLSSSAFLGDFNNFISAFFAGQPYGYSEHSDALNADRNDEAVIFLDPLGLLGNTPTEQDLRDFAQDLTAAVGRRAGELMGVRIADVDFSFFDIDLQASSNVVFNAGQFDSFAISEIFRELSGRFDSIGDTNFYLGGQNARALLDSILLSSD